MAATVPAATARSNAGGQWLAVLLRAAVIGAVIAFTLAAIVRRVRRHPADREWRRTLGRQGRRAVRRAAREDRDWTYVRPGDEGWDE